MGGPAPAPSTEALQVSDEGLRSSSTARVAGRGWELQLQWDRSVRCLAKVSYRQPWLAPCWVVVGRRVVSQGGTGGGSLPGVCASAAGGDCPPALACNAAGSGSIAVSSTLQGAAQPRTFVASQLHFLLVDEGEGESEGGMALPRAQRPLPACMQRRDVQEAGAPAHTAHAAAQPGAEQLVAVFDAPLRGLAPQQAVVLYELSREGGSGGSHAQASQPLLVAGQDASTSGWLEGVSAEAGLSFGGIEGRIGVGHCPPARGWPSRSPESWKGEIGLARTVCGHRGQPAGLRSARVCLGSAVLLVPGPTVYEEQLSALHHPRAGCP